MKRFIDHIRELFGYGLRFGAVGLIGYGIDVGIFNALRLGLLGNDSWLQGPIEAKIVSATIATLFTWFGNRYWTFRLHRRKNYWLELGEFSLVAAGGIGIGVLCLYVSHYVLGFDSLLADNIASNIVGVAFATAFRFFLYRYWVFGHHRADGLSARTRQAERDDGFHDAEVDDDKGLLHG